MDSAHLGPFQRVQLIRRPRFLAPFGTRDDRKFSIAVSPDDVSNPALAGEGVDGSATDPISAPHGP